ncbi:unnamed protein product [Arabis nemorensis]|uniref:RRM domain-containing protein n=1 Tax=Arabis nemorensis TaxID=586526 RepID=A0A565C810_9BRAS|nr:unnamed protein product [Arabis nemorensis]
MDLFYEGPSSSLLLQNKTRLCSCDCLSASSSKCLSTVPLIFPTPRQWKDLIKLAIVLSIDFFKNVGKVVRVQFIVNHEGKHAGYGFVQFASSNQAKKALQKKNGEFLHDHKIVLRKTIKIAPPPKYEEDYIGRESLLIEEDEAVEGLDETLEYSLSPISLPKLKYYIYAGEVVRVRLIVNQEGKHVGYGFVEFASAKEAMKALQTKNGEYLHDHKIFLDVAKTAPYPPRPNYEDYIRRESFLIKEDETVEGLDETPDFVEVVAVRKKTLYVANLPCEMEISDIINFFKDVGEVVHVRRLLTSKGKYAGFGFVEFASAKEAKKALRKKNGEYLHDHKIKLEKANKIAPPPKYEDYLRREGLLIKEDEAVEGLDETHDFVEAGSVRKRTLFVTNLPYNTEISNIIHFFKDVGEVVHIRLIVNDMEFHEGCCFVEFASANEAEKALEKKNCKRNRKIFLDVTKTAPYPLQPKYEDYLPRESLLIEEDEAVEGLDETPDFVEAVPIREATLYIANLPFGTEISDVIDFFEGVGEVVHVRLIVNSKVEHVGYGFVEFASANEAMKALQTKHGEYMDNRDIVLEKANEIAPTNKRLTNAIVFVLISLYREDYLLKKPKMETEPILKRPKMEEFCGKRIIFSYDDE